MNFRHWIVYNTANVFDVLAAILTAWRFRGITLEHPEDERADFTRTERLWVKCYVFWGTFLHATWSLFVIGALTSGVVVTGYLMVEKNYMDAFTFILILSAVTWAEYKLFDREKKITDRYVELYLYYANIRLILRRKASKIKFGKGKE